MNIQNILGFDQTHNDRISPLGKVQKTSLSYFVSPESNCVVSQDHQAEKLSLRTFQRAINNRNHHDMNWKN